MDRRRGDGERLPRIDLDKRLSNLQIASALHLEASVLQEYCAIASLARPVKIHTSDYLLLVCSSR